MHGRKADVRWLESEEKSESTERSNSSHSRFIVFNISVVAIYKSTAMRIVVFAALFAVVAGRTLVQINEGPNANVDVLNVEPKDLQNTESRARIDAEPTYYGTSHDQDSQVENGGDSSDIYYDNNGGVKQSTDFKVPSNVGYPKPSESHYPKPAKTYYPKPKVQIRPPPFFGIL